MHLVFYEYSCVCFLLISCVYLKKPLVLYVLVIVLNKLDLFLNLFCLEL